MKCVHVVNGLLWDSAGQIYGEEVRCYSHTNRHSTHTHTHITVSQGCRLPWRTVEIMLPDIRENQNSCRILSISQVACNDEGEPLASSFYRTDALSYLEPT